ncbi:phosphonate C-P lyase system protein PhnG [Geminicoccus flavidas]|uniref:phosphonate C-P lyase system protein PhnG n=1 Tax=Geminicoccus flavidas TaxID=2506407 RepID=UPI00135727EA|nr:phosphonate C-P lyase system protein PhnG [Geminicoccus flavidas]
MTELPPLRARWLQALAMASDAEAERFGQSFGVDDAQFELLRAPEVGLVMARGRAGGTGAAFNLGEVTVTRCAVRSSDDRVGIGWVQGRRPERARLIARLDALLQSAPSRAVDAAVAELEAALAGRRAATARKAAATRVEFFTLVRGED